MVYVGARPAAGLVVAGLFLSIFGAGAAYLQWTTNKELSGVGMMGLAAAAIGVLLIAAFALKKPQRVEITPERITVNRVSADAAACGVSEIRLERVQKRTYEIFDFTAMGPNGEIVSVALRSFDWPALREIHGHISRVCAEAQARARRG